MDIKKKAFPYCQRSFGFKETFDYITTKKLIITSPQPSLDNLGRYYESEDYISHTDSKRFFI
jgi:hypothetical protein